MLLARVGESKETALFGLRIVLMPTREAEEVLSAWLQSGLGPISLRSGKRRFLKLALQVASESSCGVLA